MQMKFFTVPVYDPAEAEAAVNAFLRGNRILQIDRHFESLPGGGAWVICVEYLPNMAPGMRKSREGKKPKVDYKEALAPEVFKRFETLRTIRKDLAKAEGLAIGKTPGTAGPRIGTTTAQTIATTIWASVWPPPPSSTRQ
ncbi:MAG: hypothetical protein RIC19_02810 [Phaeodactylibacter sp.]|uniref:hypothetical protein n=1 Tax=Phaeodactylibacter sp. TaxID=1940289 RepID=UPI0032ED279A